MALRFNLDFDLAPLQRLASAGIIDDEASSGAEEEEWDEEEEEVTYWGSEGGGEGRGEEGGEESEVGRLNKAEPSIAAQAAFLVHRRL